MKLSLVDINKQFDGKILFKDLNFEVMPGETICIKTGVLDGGTTLLKIMAGLQEPSSGKVLLDDKAIVDYQPTDLFNNLAMCFEDGGVLDVFTNYNNIVLPMLYHLDIEHDEIHKRIYRVANKLHLEEHMGKEPFQLNDVQKRLLNLCKALVIEPKLIIIDELQSGMSVDIRDNVIEFLKAEQDEMGFSIVMTTTAGDRTDFADKTFSISDYTLIEEIA